VVAPTGSAAARTFASSLPSHRRSEAAEPDNARALEALVHAARVAWPDVALTELEFAGYLAEHLPGDGPMKRALEAFHAEDLYLAAGCAKADERALRHFDRRYLASSAYLPASARRTDAKEALQQLREHLFVCAPGEAPRITKYSGRAPLGAWVKMVATRLTLDRQRSDIADERRSEQALDPDVVTHDPELQLLNATYHTQLRESLQSTLKGLPARDAALLRLHFIEGQTAETIGRVYDVAGRTVRRWLAEIRDRILEELRERLKRDHGIGGSQLKSLERFARNELDVTLSRLLKRSR
jgi:RNA polymerase sigma-70 factor (ECF subfamily)